MPSLFKFLFSNFTYLPCRAPGLHEQTQEISKCALYTLMCFQAMCNWFTDIFSVILCSTTLLREDNSDRGGSGNEQLFI